MSLASKAAEDIKNFAKKLKPFLDAAEALEQIGSIENAASEAEIRKSKAYAEADKALAEAHASYEKAQKAKMEHAKTLEYGEVLKKEVSEKASMIVVEANKKAVEIEIKAKKVLDAAVEKSKGLSLDHAELGVKVEAKKEELKEIEGKIAELKSKLASFMR